MPRGLDILSIANSTFLTLVSRFATSIVNFFESVQKMFLADQSIAIPSGDFIPIEGINSVSLSLIGRILDKNQLLILKRRYF